MNIVKTDKQILLKSLEVAEEYKHYINELDIISVSKNSFAHFFENTDDNIEYNAIPFISEGVFEYTHKEPVREYIIFKSEIIDDVCHVEYTHMMSYNNVGDYIWICNGTYTTNNTLKDEVVINFESYLDAALMIYEKQKRSDSFINSYISGIQMEKYDIIQTFHKTMIWINYLLLNPEKKVVQAKEHSTTSGSKVNKKRNEAEHEPRHINLNEISLTLYDKKVITKVKSKKPQRICQCWNVRGHYRHYKNGKVVYIKPFEKGNNRTKNSAKPRKKYNL